MSASNTLLTKAITAITAIMAREDKDTDAFTQDGRPTVLAVEREMGEGYSITATDRDVAWTRYKAEAMNAPSPASEALGHLPELAEPVVEEAGTDGIDGPASSDTHPEAQADNDTGGDDGSEPEFDQALFDRVAPIAAAAGWNAIRTIKIAETVDRYAMQEWDYASKVEKDALLKALREGEEGDLSACDAIHPHLFAVAVLLMDVVEV